MWLLNVITRRLESFTDDREVYGLYAVLSHTWRDKEVTFEEIHDPEVRGKRGYEKIEFTCRQTILEGLKYAWIDTCCIDKRSSAELSEAINSMYRWYYHSKICFAYLPDVTTKPSKRLPKVSHSLLNQGPMVGTIAESVRSVQRSLRNARWFTRGWTLQELIAPSEVLFFDDTWQVIGSKSELVPILASITLIDEKVLLDRTALESTCIAQRMSWASRRSTSREEDQAYSLLGIFNITMPLLYGEGSRAFERLQEQIVRDWSRIDHSVLLWEGESGTLLAPSAQAFRGRNAVRTWSLPQQATFDLSSNGLRIDTIVGTGYEIGKDFSQCQQIIIALNATDSITGLQLGLRLRRRLRIDNVEDITTLLSSETAHSDHVWERESGILQLHPADTQASVMATLTIGRERYQMPETANAIAITCDCLHMSRKSDWWSPALEPMNINISQLSLGYDGTRYIYVRSPTLQSTTLIDRIEFELIRHRKSTSPPFLAIHAYRGRSFWGDPVSTSGRIVLKHPGETQEMQIFPGSHYKIASRFLLNAGVFMWHLHIEHLAVQEVYDPHSHNIQQLSAGASPEAQELECSLPKKPEQFKWPYRSRHNIVDSDVWKVYEQDSRQELTSTRQHSEDVEPTMTNSTDYRRCLPIVVTSDEQAGTTSFANLGSLISAANQQCHRRICRCLPSSTLDPQSRYGSDLSTFHGSTPGKSNTSQGGFSFCNNNKPSSNAG